MSIAYGASPRLRPASPAADQHGCGTLGHSVGGIRTPLALLMPTFALPAAPPFASAAPKTPRATRVCTIAPAHIGQGSFVTYKVQSVRRQSPTASSADVNASISACAVAFDPVAAPPRLRVEAEDRKERGHRIRWYGLRQRLRQDPARRPRQPFPDRARPPRWTSPAPPGASTSCSPRRIAPQAAASTTDGVGESQRAAVELSRMSGELTELVNRFRV